MTTPDWHSAQVIEATTPSGARRALQPASRRGYWWELVTELPRYQDQLSDVRIIVDADGNVAPPPITDDMVERCRGLQGTPEQIRAIMTAALGGDR